MGRETLWSALFSVGVSGRIGPVCREKHGGVTSVICSKADIFLLSVEANLRDVKIAIRRPRENICAPSAARS